MQKHNVFLVLALALILSLTTSVFAEGSTKTTAKVAAQPKAASKPQSATTAANAYFATTLRKHIKYNPVGGVISAKMIDLDGDKAKEMVIYSYTPPADSSMSMAGNIYIYDYEKGKGTKTGTISFSGAGSQPVYKLSSTKNIIEDGSNGNYGYDKVYTYKNQKLTCTTIFGRAYDDPSDYSINAKSVTKAQFDTAVKKSGITNATYLIEQNASQFSKNELQSIIASDKTISSKADYKKTAYTDFINSGAYIKVINGNENELICYTLLPSDKNGNYDLLMIYTDKQLLNDMSKAQYAKGLPANSASFYNTGSTDSYVIGIYRNVSGVMKLIVSEYVGLSTRSFLSIYRNAQTGKIGYFEEYEANYGDDYEFGRGHASLFYDVLNNTKLTVFTTSDEDKSTYFKNDKSITKAAYDKEKSDFNKNNKSFTITYIPYGK